MTKVYGQYENELFKIEVVRIKGNGFAINVTAHATTGLEKEEWGIPIHKNDLLKLIGQLDITLK